MAACQRGIVSCKRCRKRKIKCDRQLPSCSQCIRAKSPCIGISPSAQEIPRSIVQNLETEIARLESRLRVGIDNASSETLMIAPEIDRPMETRCTVSYQRDALRDSIVSSISMREMVSVTVPCVSTATSLSSKVWLGMNPSSEQLGIALDNSATNSGKEQSYLDVRVLRSIRSEALEPMVSRYITTIHCHNPVFNISDLWYYLEHVVQTLNSGENLQAIMPSYEFLVIYLILATSVTLGAAEGQHESQRMALSASLFEEGMCHFYSLKTFPSDIIWIQTILLILLYATILPSSANLWVLSGAAMRGCVELGLHREAPKKAGLDVNVHELRKCIFWTAYCIDRSICSIFQRPLSIPDATISTQEPQQQDDSQNVFIGSIQYCKLLSEIVHVHFDGGALPGGVTWDEWLTKMEDKLRRWHSKYYYSSQYYESAEFSMARGMMILHRPSPRTPILSNRSLLVAFEYAANSARLHHDQIRSTFLRRPWLSAHYTLEASTITLFCLRHGCVPLRGKFDLTQILDMTKLFTPSFVAIAAQGWPEVLSFAGVYERLLGTLLDGILSTPGVVNSKFTPAQDTELTHLLYPGPAHLKKLRFGRVPHVQVPPVNFELLGVEYGVFEPVTLDDDETSASWDMTDPGFVPRGIGLGLPLGFQW